MTAGAAVRFRNSDLLWTLAEARAANKVSEQQLDTLEELCRNHDDEISYLAIHPFDLPPRYIEVHIGDIVYGVATNGQASS